MAIFAKLLVAQQAMIESLQSTLIQVKAMIFGGERFVINNGQVNDRGKNYIGFSLDNKGILKASGAEISGHIEAESGTLDNITIKEHALFLGTIKSGPIFVSNETTTPVPPTTFGVGTRVSDIVNSVGINATINVSSGSYGVKSGLVAMITTHSTIRTSSIVGGNIVYTGYQHTWTLKLVFNDNTENSFTGTGHSTSSSPTSSMSTYSGTIAQQLQFGGSIAGKIFIIENLPTGSTGLQRGTVYRNGNQLMIV
jgi:hypothetical protein